MQMHRNFKISHSRKRLAFLPPTTAKKGTAYGTPRTLEYTASPYTKVKAREHTPICSFSHVFHLFAFIIFLYLIAIARQGGARDRGASTRIR